MAGTNWYDSIVKMLSPEEDDGSSLGETTDVRNQITGNAPMPTKEPEDVATPTMDSEEHSLATQQMEAEADALRPKVDGISNDKNKPTKAPTLEEQIDAISTAMHTKTPKHLKAVEVEDFQDKYDEVQDWYDDMKDRLGKAELAETVGHAIAQLGAGWVGLNTGRDMTGLKFNKTNWDKKMDTAFAEFKHKRARIDKQEQRNAAAVAESKRAEERDLGREDTAKYRKAGLEIDKLKMKQQAKQDKANRIAKSISKIPKEKKDGLDKILGSAASNEQKAAQASLLLGVPISTEEVQLFDGWGRADDEENVLETRQRLRAKAATVDPDAQKYADLHKIPYEQAKAIIDKRKGL